ncbi:hypothetical protein M441DRAFT_213069 [Trichoderma asperellum CBS 433.97]|uniref:Uncharacterized protein n=1 Tax=Trichoderma asperellum (strain ATCC 204424 / CBS 433.97 / NBRC 101777) TaxID=1042311 RepID=A0A2T3ZND4_TRIA4|nr:hypothetical protein M441DRAFT_213069 [Trichoderma asperellum CBS 433.97]PTB46306.1 hypothetical protein M441DRAFT_213069 [Trichoderma asperellum CBS 433.97]
MELSRRMMLWHISDEYRLLRPRIIWSPAPCTPYSSSRPCFGRLHSQIGFHGSFLLRLHPQTHPCPSMPNSEPISISPTQAQVSFSFFLLLARTSLMRRVAPIQCPLRSILLHSRCQGRFALPSDTPVFCNKGA